MKGWPGTVVPEQRTLWDIMRESRGCTKGEEPMAFGEIYQSIMGALFSPERELPHLGPLSWGGVEVS